MNGGRVAIGEVRAAAAAVMIKIWEECRAVIVMRASFFWVKRGHIGD
jgi:hypothetical protein